ncbi:hypothetical protein [Seonamhaeicola sp.]|uniref:hypothetical protein n=1 Tax=Seonamhaeicola sp. TaxID=1912245 RepID=UPI00356A6778
MNNIERVAHITSSKIYLLCQTSTRDKKSPITGNKWSAGALTYFEEKRIERKLGKCLDLGGYSRPSSWGTFLEMVVFNHLGLEYKIESKDTTEHPDEEFKNIWSGSRDLIVPGVKIGEIKCYQLKKFAQYTDALTIPITKTFTMAHKIQNLKDNFSDEYWQMVSNAILNEVNIAEAISFCPYESELEGIRELAENYDGDDQWQFKWIAMEKAENLALLKDGGHYQNLNMFEFEVPKEDIEFLTERVRLAKKEIII